jgi:ArsR family metal-binding transcriptional regulator
MTFMDKVKESFDKTKAGVSEFAETAKIKHEITQLNDRKAALCGEIGRQIYALYGQGRVITEVEGQCREIKAIDEDIKHKAEEIANIHAAS